jgi:outer membrane protein assembly factor BamB
MFAVASGLAAADWPQYRGPTHDGNSTDRINQNWSGTVTNPVWLVAATNGLSSFSVSGGRAFTQIGRTLAGSPEEVCIALSVTNGAELWATPVGDAIYPQGGVGPDDGPRSTPSVDGGSVYVLNSYLTLYRLNATNGAITWSTNLVAGYGGSVIPWQNAASPVLESGLIFLNANCGTATLMALSTNDGSLVWRSQDEALTHSTPTLATIGGVRQLLFATQSGLVSLAPQTGQLLWRFPYPFFYSTSLAVSPVVSDDLVFVCGAHAYAMGSVAVQVSFSNNVWTATQLWFTNNPACHWMTPVARQGYLYGQFGIQQYDSPNAQLSCIDMRSGALLWATPGFGRGGTLLVDDLLLALTEQGDLVLVKPDPTAYTELARFNAIPNYDQYTNRCWNSPAVADGKVYVRSTAFAGCFDLSIPSLRLDPPSLAAPGRLQLTIRTVDGTAIDSNRFATLGVLTSPDANTGLQFWSQLTNSLFLTNGLVQIFDLDATQPRQFFIATEPK